MAKKAGLESMTALLKEHDAPISAVKANKLMLEKGLMEERERPSNAAGKEHVMKKYKVLTEAGLAFGVNQENPQSPDQTSPYYERELFRDLLLVLLEPEPDSKS